MDLTLCDLKNWCVSGLLDELFEFYKKMTENGRESCWNKISMLKLRTNFIPWRNCRCPLTLILSAWTWSGPQVHCLQELTWEIRSKSFLVLFLQKCFGFVFVLSEQMDHMPVYWGKFAVFTISYGFLGLELVDNTWALCFIRFSLLCFILYYKFFLICTVCLLM
jgi:hypothetical protein